MLLSDKADISDPQLTAALRKYFDRTSPKSNRVRYCGIAMVGFDADFYPAEDAKAVAEDIATAAKSALKNWLKNIVNRLSIEKLDQFKIEFLCIPVPSVDRLREEFKKAIGLQ